MSTKQEIIKQAYGERWEFVKDNVDENGWFPDSILGDAIWVLSECEREFINNELHWRITSLKGIEDNNGWIKLNGLPNEITNRCSMWIMTKNGIEYLKENEFLPIGYATHYKPIEKPKPPIY